MTDGDNLNFTLSQVAAGNQQAFRKLFTQFSGKVYTYAFKLTHTKEAAEEIVQDVFLKIWNNRTILTTIEYFPAYLYTITRNHTLNFLKHLSVEKKARTVFSEQFSPTEETAPEPVYLQMLLHAIDKLPPQQQLVYKMCYHDGLKYEEVAQRLSISRLTVKTHMQQALRAIRTHLGTISIN